MGHFGTPRNYTAIAIPVGTFTGAYYDATTISVDGPIITTKPGSNLLGVYVDWTVASSTGMRFRLYVKDPLKVGNPWFNSQGESVMPSDNWETWSTNAYRSMGKSGNLTWIGLTMSEGMQGQGVIIPGQGVQLRVYGRGDCLSSALNIYLSIIL